MEFAFIKGRQILDNILIAKYKRRKKEGDRQTSFGEGIRQNWFGLLRLHHGKKGFGFKWRLWIHACISAAHYSILLMATPKDNFSATRGLRQGDPLLSFLFTLVADSLSQIITNVETAGIFRGFQVGSEKDKVLHLRFADATLFLMKGEHRNI